MGYKLRYKIISYINYYTQLLCKKLILQIPCPFKNEMMPLTDYITMLCFLMFNNLYSLQVTHIHVIIQVTHALDNANQMYAELASFPTISSTSPQAKAPETEYTTVGYRQTDTNIDEDNDSD